MGTLTYAGELARADECRNHLFGARKFWLSQKVPRRSQLIAALRSHGGLLCPFEEVADILIVDPVKLNSARPGSISFRYIEKSIENGKLENLEDHAVGPSVDNAFSKPPITQPSKTTRAKFTPEEDRMLLQWVEQVYKAGGSLKGNKIYIDFAQTHKEHPWQSWRDRYVKHHINQHEPRIRAIVQDNANAKQMRLNFGPSTLPQKDAHRPQEAISHGTEPSQASSPLKRVPVSSKNTVSEPQTPKFRMPQGFRQGVFEKVPLDRSDTSGSQPLASCQMQEGRTAGMADEHRIHGQIIEPDLSGPPSLARPQKGSPKKHLKKQPRTMMVDDVDDRPSSVAPGRNGISITKPSKHHVQDVTSPSAQTFTIISSESESEPQSELSAADDLSSSEGSSIIQPSSPPSRLQHQSQDHPCLKSQSARPLQHASALPYFHNQKSREPETEHGIRDRSSDVRSESLAPLAFSTAPTSPVSSSPQICEPQIPFKTSFVTPPNALAPHELEVWVSRFTSLGLSSDLVELVLVATTLDHLLAGEVLEDIHTTHGRSAIHMDLADLLPSDRRGVWTAKDDEILQSSRDTREIRGVELKHGGDLVTARWHFLEFMGS